MTKNATKRFDELFAVPLRNGLTRPKAVRGEGTKMVNMGEIFSHARIGDIEMDRVLLSEHESAFLLQARDLLFARQSLVLSGAGKCSLFCGANEPVTFESHLIRCRLRPDIADSAFYFYFFQSPRGRQTMESIVEQVAAAGIRGRDLARLEVPHPSLTQQRAISAVLGALDDKIELNRRMNATLEAAARALFQSWFVDFDPVRAKLDGRPPPNLDPATAALFPASFQNSSLGPIPQGWEEGTLGDIGANPRRTVQPSEIAPNTPYIALEHMPRRCIALDDWDDSADVVSGKFTFNKGEVLFGKLRPYFHKVGIAPLSGVCSTDILVLTPKAPEWFGVLIGHASSDALVQFADLASTGTKMPRTNWSDLSSFRVGMPPLAIAAAFTHYVQPMFDRIIANIHESRTLATLRDTLLPRLLSGELSVSTAAETIP